MIIRCKLLPYIIIFKPAVHKKILEFMQIVSDRNLFEVTEENEILTSLQTQTDTKFLESEYSTVCIRVKGKGFFCRTEYYDNAFTYIFFFARVVLIIFKACVVCYSVKIS